MINYIDLSGKTMFCDAWRHYIPYQKGSIVLETLFFPDDHKHYNDPKYLSIPVFSLYCFNNFPVRTPNELVSNIRNVIPIEILEVLNNTNLYISHDEKLFDYFTKYIGLHD